MERRLIDGNALKEAFEEDGHLSGYIEEYIDNCPTIDAVEVVRCRECRYKHVPRCCPYRIAGYGVDDDWYCPMGIRREPDGE